MTDLPDGKIPDQVRSADEKGIFYNIDNKLLETAISLRGKISKEALQLVEIVLNHNPNRLDAIVLAGLICQDMDKISDATDYFKKVLEISPDYPDALKSYGLLNLSYKFEIVNQEKLDLKREGYDLLVRYLAQDNWEDVETLEKIINVSDEIGAAEEAFSILKDAWEKTLSPQIGIIYAKHLHKRSKTDEAVRLLELLSKKSKNPDIFNLLAHYMEEAAQYEKAILLYQQAISFAEEIFKLLIDNINSEEMQIDVEALKKFDYPKNGWIDLDLPIFWCNLSECYLKSGKNQEALQAANNALKLFDSADNWVAKIYALLALQQYDNVFETINMAYLSDDVDSNREVDNFVKIKLLEELTLEKTNRTTEALKILEDGVIRYSQYWEFHYRLYKLLKKLGQMDEAAYALKHALASLEVSKPFYWEENYQFFQWEYFLFLHGLGRQDLAIKIISSALQGIKKIPSYIEDHIHIGFGSEDLKIQQRTIQIIEQLYTHFPENPDVIHLEFELQLANNNVEMAQKVLEKAQDLEQSSDINSVFLNNLGYLYLLQSKFDLAETVLKKALEIESNDDYSLSEKTVGIAFYLEGKILSGEWGNLNPPPSWYPELTVIAVFCNLITLNLAKGDVDEATRLTIELLTTHATKANELGDLALLFLARCRGDQKTARQAWQNYQNREDKPLEEQELSQQYPELYAWLSETPKPEDASKQIEK